MRRSKYILFFIFIILLTTNNVLAAKKNVDWKAVANKVFDKETCYYIGGGFKATFVPEDNKIYVDVIGTKPDHDGEKMLNYCATSLRANTTEAGDTFDNYLNTWCVFSGNINYCPNYLVIQAGCGPEGYRIWGVQTKKDARTAANNIDSLTQCTGKYAGFRDELTGEPITAEEYYRSFVDQELIAKDIEEGKECESIFGDKNDEGEYGPNGEEISPPSLAYIINRVLGYVRVIVPIIVILLGTIDFATAVVAGKEDSMKSAQQKFIKRLIISLIVFFVPQIVNVIMWLADIVWEGLGYATCTLD